MAYSAPTYETIRDAILREITSQVADADVTSDSDNFVRSAAVAAVVEGIYQRLAWIYRQIFPDLADDEELLHHAAIRGLVQKVATAAEGIAAINGSAGVTLASGAVFTHVASGELLTANADTTVGSDGTATVAVTAQTAGASLNGLSGALILTSPPLGMDSDATLTGDLVGGVDAESMASLLGRLLDIIRNPPAGGATYDYRRWALEVNGVASATVLPRRRGPTTVDVVITGADGVPSQAVIDACAAYIEELRPVTAEVFVYAPLVRVVDAAAQVELEDGYTLAEVQAAATIAYAQSLGALLPGEILRRSRIDTLISNLAGVVDRVVQAPAANVPATDVADAVGWIRPGTIILSLMP
ncbi:baseplate J/gp47 family protein [Stutzerimonas kirkiae]|uniref:baseplate J/gp47 family protein n=1 Tax=Stutzerimonas kirkiae TaxID=2211392 RepID=UPI001038457D|nr:baseplate J/gp47 family protein [Stutzerimonas kirkiae]TBV12747.1 phage tail protein [Stutzerimonas kirkiae]